MARILLVEDSAPVRWTLSQLLRFEGHQVDHAANGAQALDCFETRSFDLVLMDVYLDGLETCRQLRRESPVPILMFSTSGDPALRQRALTCGASAFLVKPIEFKGLLNWVQAACRNGFCQAANVQRPFHC